MKHALAEIYHVEKVIKKLSKFGSLFEAEVLGEVKAKKETLPIYGLRLGSKDPELPVLGVFGGVHGLEKIGTHVIVNYLNLLSNNLTWDKDLAKNFEKFRLVSIPIVNPGGMYLRYRSNPNGVDLMRNSPTQAQEKGVFLGSGQNYTKYLPWYRGNPAEPELENKILANFVKEQMFRSPFSMALDIHSGFGWTDSLWYPYGKSFEKFHNHRQATVFSRYLKVTHPFHKYNIEKQSDSYIISGDMWDYLYDSCREQAKPEQVFIPWTLELGSWSWILKRPHKMFSASALFHTEQSSSRYASVMRKHWGLLEFFQKMTINHRAWVSQKASKKTLNRAIGF